MNTTKKLSGVKLLLLSLCKNRKSIADEKVTLYVF